MKKLMSKEARGAWNNPSMRSWDQAFADAEAAERRLPKYDGSFAKSFASAMDANLTKILAEDPTLKIRRWNNACHYQAGVKIVSVDEYDISDKKDIVKAYVQEAFDKLPSEMKEQGWKLTGVRYDEDYNYFYANFISEKLKDELQNINPDAAFESTTQRNKMKRLNLTKEQFNKSRYLKNKYGSLKYVSESGRFFRTNKGQVLMFKEEYDPEDYDEVYIGRTNDYYAEEPYDDEDYSYGNDMTWTWSETMDDAEFAPESPIYQLTDSGKRELFQWLDDYEGGYDLNYGRTRGGHDSSPEEEFEILSNKPYSTQIA